MILVVSADDEIREALARKLVELGEVVTASSTADGVGRAGDADVVLLDLLTPGIDGQAFHDVKAPILVLGVCGHRPTLTIDGVVKPFDGRARLLDEVRGISDAVERRARAS